MQRFLNPAIATFTTAALLAVGTSAYGVEVFSEDSDAS